MKIGVLTSSRADYGIYLPLLSKLKNDSFFNLEIIAFGTHLSNSHGFTILDIEILGFSKVHKISSLLSNDDKQSIATSYGLTTIKFAEFWNTNKFDLVFCLGDRFEMSAAVQSGIPFGIKFAHFHGGETTLGAIDNIYRHQITIASTIHFIATNQNFSKIAELTGSNHEIYNIGSLSLDGIENFKPIEKTIFFNKFNLPKEKFALITFHPETISTELNRSFAIEMRKSLEELTNNMFLIITMPNADTMGSIYRSEIDVLKKKFPNRVLCVENFGKENYFTAIYYSKLLIGNTSSGIIEAASFRKYVVNVGSRQEGRLQSKNVFNTIFQKEAILETVYKVIKFDEFEGENIYYQKDASSNVIKILKRKNAGI
jgi:GDP/UDP-N,N'-diacetylbacillosamine 2-epimerase (hydrolysing)